MDYRTAQQTEADLVDARAEVEDAESETVFWRDSLARAKDDAEQEEAEHALVFYRRERERAAEHLVAAESLAEYCARLERMAPQRCDEARRRVRTALNPGYVFYEIRKRYGWGDPAVKAAYEALSGRTVAREESRV